MLEKTADSPANKIELLGIPVSDRSFNPEDELSKLDDKQSALITFVNPGACWIAESNEDYLKNLQEFDWVLCD